MGLLSRKKDKKPTHLPPPPPPPPVAESRPEVGAADILAKLEGIMAKLETGDNRLAAPADRLIEAADRLAQLLDIARARHPELGLENVLELSGLSRGTHYEQTDGGYLLKLPGDREYRVATVPVDKLVDGGDADGFAEQVRGMFGDSNTRLILLFPEYALAELLSRRPELLSEAAKSSTVLGTPSTILSMLDWVRIEWRYADRVGELGKVAKEMAKSIREFASLYSSLGVKLGAARDAYNASVGMWANVESTAGLAAEAVGITLEEPQKIK